MKDYYLLLGVNRKADKSEIKKAYRDSVKKYHPDGREATGDTKRFREVTEAYETLSDNGKRRKYDENLGISIPVCSQGNAEPLKPNASHYQSRYDPNPYICDYISPPPLQFFRRGNVGQKTLSCEVQLSHEEIQNDFQYPYTINIIKPCPHCNSLFSEFITYCPYCNGTQYLKTRKELIINIPGGTENGHCVKLDLDYVGLSDVTLVVTVFIGSYPAVASSGS